MTRKEILNMPMGREMDALIAEKIFGYNRVYYNEKIVANLYPTGAGCFVEGEAHEYSTDISAAWEVVEKLHELGYFLGLYRDGFKKCIWEIDIGADIELTDNTAPLAICRAALLAVMENE
jgi:hypothetical protein